jgi:hypothetical protein
MGRVGLGVSASGSMLNSLAAVAEPDAGRVRFYHTDTSEYVEPTPVSEWATAKSRIAIVG